MNLEDVYASRVQGKTSFALNLSLNGSAPTFERDPAILKMESDLFSQLAELCSDPVSNSDIKPAHQPQHIAVVSFEDALKELAEMGVSI